MLINKILGYQISTDYELLALLATKQSIVCVIDFNKELQIRDCASTNYTYKKNNGIWSISSRGYNYITAFNKEEFINYCKFKNVEFIIPNL